MNLEKANKIFEAFGKPQFKVGDTIISFARQDNSSIKEIESLSNEDLVSEWKSLVWLNNIYGQVSLNDLQRIALLQLEIEERDISSEELDNWYEKAKSEFEESYENLI